MQEILSNKKVIIFDLDGTLIDSMAIWNQIDVELLKKFGYDISQETILQNRDKILRETNFRDIYLGYCDYLREQYLPTYTAEQILNMRRDIGANYIKNVIDYKPNADKVLKRLKKMGFTLALATTSIRLHIDYYKTYNRNIIEKADFNDIFSIMLCKDDVTKPKPNPEVYYKILTTLDVSPEECIVFEDSLTGVEAAKNANIDVVTIYDKFADKDRDAINKMSNGHFDTFSDVLNILQ